MSFQKFFPALTFAIAVFVCSGCLVESRRLMGTVQAMQTTPVPLESVVMDPSEYLDQGVNVRGRFAAVDTERGIWVYMVPEETKKKKFGSAEVPHIEARFASSQIRFPRNSVGHTASLFGTLQTNDHSTTIPYLLSVTSAVIDDSKELEILIVRQPLPNTEEDQIGTETGTVVETESKL
jgi:hypothetical protein